MMDLPQVYDSNKKSIHKEKQTSDGHGETYQPYWAADDLACLPQIVKA